MSTTQNPKVEKPLSELISDVTADLGTLVRKELELARIETKQEISRTARAGGMLGAAGFAAYMALLLLSFAIVFLLALVMALWLAFLIVAVAYGVAAAVLYQQGRQRAKQIKPVPEQTVESVKEDMEWLKGQRR